MAQDLRHELAPGMLAYWKAKLSDYSDAEICNALMLHRGQFFPRVDEIVSQIERKRSAERRETVDSKQLEVAKAQEVEQHLDTYSRNFREVEKFARENGGLTPAQHWCHQNRAVVDRLEAMVQRARPLTVERRPVAKVSL